ncbi:sodium-independent sulfate anion transporter-like isoform X2 [Phlebotomus argentipes]|uniref:sodium-independent sulfate anion transporter-like isoform X2 n=1 Tax=Phlebotomus argentipes TaxID=94469 RepID=UPI0028936FAF|nr:sodium-independent sulfate anion transporter-like isoform X2 [Phlebotomus argentipes]
MYTGISGEAPPEDFSEEFPAILPILKRQVRGFCDKSTLLKRFPVLSWLPKYQLNYLFSDFVAGLTVALTAIPQGIAYAVVAGLEPQYGLYSGFMGCFMYFIFGSCKDITIGPTAIMSLMVAHYVTASPDYAVLSCFLSGVVIFLLGVLNLGFLVQFISIPVTAGFTSAAAITIASTQLKSLFGLPGQANDFIEAWSNFFHHISDIKLWDTLLGVCTVAFLLVLKRLNSIQRWRLFFRYFSLSRNAIAVITGTVLAYLLYKYHDDTPFTLTGNVASGLPPFRPPPFTTVVANETVSFSEMIHTLGSGIVAIPLVSILESVAVAKAFSKGKTVDATQEMIALGMCNIMGSFVLSMPITGSFTRTAVNNTSGVRTTLGGVFTGVIILLALGFLAQTFYFIPKTTLAAVILAAMFSMVEYELLFKLWRTRRIEVIPFMVTLISCLILGLEYGIVIGVAVNLLFVLYTTARPATAHDVRKILDTALLEISPDQSLVFSAAENFKYKVLKYTLDAPDTVSLIIINGHYVQSIDVTVAMNLNTLVADLKILGKAIVFWNWPRQAVALAWRLSPEFGVLFKRSDNVEDLVKLWHHEKQDYINGVTCN